MDVPKFDSVSEVVELADDKEDWHEDWQINANSLQYKSRFNGMHDSKPQNYKVKSNLTVATNQTHRYNLRSRNKCTM